MLFEAPLQALWPGLAIMLAVLGLNLLGDGLRDLLDPKLRRLFYDKMRTGHLQEVDKDVGSLQVTSSQNISRQLEAADEYQRVRLLISHLPEPQGRIMLMRDVEDRSFEEISIEIGLTEVNIRSILSRARKKIREQIKAMRYDKD